MKFVAIEKTSLAGFGCACALVGAAAVGAFGSIKAVAASKRGDSRSALAAWHHNYVSSLLTSGLALASAASFLATARGSSQREQWVLPAAASIVSCIPLLAAPVGDKLAATPVEAASEATDALIGTWGKLQCVEAGLGLLAVAGCLAAVFAKRA